jgi:alpha-galactosidase
VIHLKDAVSGLKVQLLYTIYHDLPVLVRSASFEADGQDLVLIKAASLSIDFPPSPREVVSLGGDWAAEFKRSRSAVQPGMHSLASRHGASSHQFNPFVALVDPDTDEEHGDAFGFSLVWSGSWLGEIETSTFGLSRLTMGINPELFEWQLKAGATQFDTPECIAVFSRRGLGRMSRTFHDFMKKHISQSPWQDRDRPTLVNSWEAAYFSFNQAKLVQLGSASKPYGVKTLVMDDGWFGSDTYPRNNDTQGLGDWTALSDKLPNGLRGLAKELSTIGIELGVWIEPESVNVKSKLFERFPHWAHQTEGYPLTESRNQLLLDFGRTEVQDWAIETFAEILQHVTFVKLDFNRGIFETKINGAFGHVKGLYRVLGVLAGRFGERVLFENCASGGGRMDPGKQDLIMARTNSN